jgi:hypothetical protein
MMGSVSRCRFCGTFVSKEDRFCWACGEELQRKARTEQRLAPAALEADHETELAIRRAFVAQQRGELQEAERLVREALTRDPGNVAALAMLSELLRTRGDLVGAVEAAHRAAEGASGSDAPRGSVARAREERARIEDEVVRDVVGPYPERGVTPLHVFSAEGAGGRRLSRLYLALMGMGVTCLFMALVAALRGEMLGYVWFAVSLTAAGWCYWDAESRRHPGLFWGPFVLCLGPFGVAIYLLARY